MDKSTPKYEEVHSSDFSEDYDSDSEQISSDEELEKKAITRAFWVKKETLITKEKEFKRRNPETDLKKDIRSAEKVQIEPTDNFPLSENDVLTIIFKIGNFSKSKGELVKQIDKLMTLIERAKENSSKMLLFFQCFESIVESFNLLEKDLKVWEEIWEKAKNVFKKFIDLINGKEEKIIKDYLQLERFFENKTDNEDNNDNSQPFGKNYRKSIIIRQKLTRNFFLNSISSFISDLSRELKSFSLNENNKFDQELINKYYSDLKNLILESKKFFSTIKSKPGLLITTKLLISCYNNESADENVIEELCNFVICNSDCCDKDKIITSLILTNHYIFTNQLTQADNLFKIISKKISEDEQDNEITLSYNRSMAKLAIGFFIIGKFDRSASLLGPKQLSNDFNFFESIGQKKNSKGKKLCPEREHIDADLLKSAINFSSIFKTSEYLAKKMIGCEPQCDFPYTVQMYSNFEEDFLYSEKDPFRYSAMRCIEFLLLSDWRACEEYFSCLEIISSPKLENKLRENLFKEAKKTSLKIFIIRYADRFLEISYKNLSNLFELQIEEITNELEKLEPNVFFNVLEKNGVKSVVPTKRLNKCEILVKQAVDNICNSNKLI